MWTFVKNLKVVLASFLLIIILFTFGYKSILYLAGEEDIEPPKTGIDTNSWLSVLGLSSILLGLVKIKRRKEN